MFHFFVLSVGDAPSVSGRVIWDYPQEWKYGRILVLFGSYVRHQVPPLSISHRSNYSTTVVPVQSDLTVLSHDSYGSMGTVYTGRNRPDSYGDVHPGNRDYRRVIRLP